MNESDGGITDDADEFMTTQTTASQPSTTSNTKQTNPPASSSQSNVQLQPKSQPPKRNSGTWHTQSSGEGEQIYHPEDSKADQIRRRMYNRQKKREQQQQGR